MAEIAGDEGIDQADAAMLIELFQPDETRTLEILGHRFALNG